MDDLAPSPFELAAAELRQRRPPRRLMKRSTSAGQWRPSGPRLRPIPQARDAGDGRAA